MGRMEISSSSLKFFDQRRLMRPSYERPAAKLEPGSSPTRSLAVRPLGSDELHDPANPLVQRKALPGVESALEHAPNL